MALQSDNEALRAYAESVKGLLAEVVLSVKKDKKTLRALRFSSDRLCMELAFFRKRYPSPVALIPLGRDGEEEGEETDVAAERRLNAQLHRYSVLIRNANSSGYRAAPDLVCEPDLRQILAWFRKEVSSDGFFSIQFLKEAGYFSDAFLQRLRIFGYADGSFFLQRLQGLGYIKEEESSRGIFTILPKGQQVYLPEMDE